MPQSLSKVFVHIAFCTKERRPLIDDELAPRLFNYLGGVCNSLGCDVVQVGGYRDHVHVCCLLARAVSQSELIETLKKRSSKWTKTLSDSNWDRRDFYWQDGYGIFSVKPTEVDSVVEYILKQKEHHETHSFQDEFRMFLKKYGVEYDERYVWG